MVRSPYIDDPVKTPRVFVEVIRDVGRKIGGLTISPDNDSVLLVVEVCRPEPQRAPFFVYESLVLKSLKVFVPLNISRLLNTYLLLKRILHMKIML